MEDRGHEDPEINPTPFAAVPYGGDKAVARSIAAVHVRNPWTGRCRSCAERYPCADRQDADAVLGPLARPQRHAALILIFALIAVVTGALAAAVVAKW